MYADVCVDISHEKLDRPFEYHVPEEMEGTVKVGSQVNIPFGRGNKLIKGFVMNLKSTPAYRPSAIKDIDSVVKNSTSLESTMLELAYFIKTNYGSTMNRALKTVLPVKQSAKPLASRYIYLIADHKKVTEVIDKLSKGKASVAKLRLLKELANEKMLPYSIVKDKLNISPSTLKALERDGMIRIDEKENLRKSFNLNISKGYSIVLNDIQQQTADGIWTRYKNGDTKPSLIHGITGSGKTEIYIDLIDRVVKEGRQAIVLIPEIALTYQTVLRFYKKFGDRISVINSKLTPAQKYDQLKKAREGMVDIIIGPRSALFAPFKNLGIVIIDEEHEGTYINENVPRYDAREVAIKRAGMSGGFVVLGSATPSVDSFYMAEKGEYQLYKLNKRAAGASLPGTEIVDLREELNSGNRSIISRRLNELILDRLSKKEQIILFMNRRGYSSFVSCRSCGDALKCPHCDVSLKYHKDGTMRCHYCGYETPMVKTCPKCGSKYIGTFGTGTQKVEEEINRLYPQAVTLRMDADTTKNKDGHEKILSAFANCEADILIGTQMIVKGHDFANVTLVGILAADMSLYAGDYQAPERTFALLTQASGRAGRGSKPGNVVIQTYSPENYAVRFGAEGNYEGFYDTEIKYRRLLGYPPVRNMLAVMFSSEDERKLIDLCGRIGDKVKSSVDGIEVIGPTEAAIARINDRYRRIMYVKSGDYEKLTAVKDLVESIYESNPDKEPSVVFDFSGRL